MLARIQIIAWYVCTTSLLACAPPGYEKAAFTGVKWPDSDQPSSIEQRAEIEGRLRALNYAKGTADTVITHGTREAKSAFQSDIGAPANGYVSAQLLDALRTSTANLSNEQLGLNVRPPALTQQPIANTVQASPASTTTTNASADRSGGSDLERGDAWGVANASWIIANRQPAGYSPADAAIRAAKAATMRNSEEANAAREVLGGPDARALDAGAQRLMRDLGTDVALQGAFGPASQAALDTLSTKFNRQFPDTPRERVLELAKTYWETTKFRVDLY